MMSEGVGHSPVQIKKEMAEGVVYQSQSPSPSCTNLYSPSHDVAKMEFNEPAEDGITNTVFSCGRSPGSPDQQFCSSTTQSLGELNQQEGLKEELPRRLCLVCGDVASGFHYGVASCEACKAFFKRTIQGNIEYTCPAANDCEINKRRRKACQACRFQKCLLMGMLKEGVRLDRVRGGRQKYRRNPETPYQMQVVHPLIKMSLEDIKVLEVLSAYEPEPLQTGGVCLGSEGSVKTLTLLSDLYDRELVGVIGWAKQIPGFTDLLLNDQMRLLQSSWVELLTLMLAHRSLPSHGCNGGTNGNPTVLQFAADFTLDERQARDCGALELYQHVIQVIGRLHRLGASREEYFLLKALALANSDARLDEPTALRKFRESILGALGDCVMVLRPANSSMHLQQLLLVLPSLRQSDHVVRRFWSIVHRDNKVPMNKLFVEMLEAVTR